MPSRPRTAVAAVAVAVATVALLAACSTSDPGEVGATPDGCTTSLFGQPVEPPDTSGEPPTDLTVASFETGQSGLGPAAAPGDLLLVDYTLHGWHAGSVLDTSENHGPYSLELGAGMVVPGWDQGLVGLRLCERARLVVPPELGYGAGGVPSRILPNETLVFDVQVVRIAPGGEPSGPPPTTTP